MTLFNPDQLAKSLRIVFAALGVEAPGGPKELRAAYFKTHPDHTVGAGEPEPRSDHESPKDG